MTSLTASLQNAISGMKALGRVSEAISSNVANATTEGYAPRSAVISQRAYAGAGAGTTVVAVQRHTDPILIQDRRTAIAELGTQSLRSEFYSVVENKIGLPDATGSLSNRLSEFGSSLVLAASRPDSESRLELALNAAKSVASMLNDASDTIQEQRMRADQSIDTLVEQVNTTLEKIASLNTQIMRAGPRETERLTISDERQRLLDGLSEIIPIRELRRDSGAIALFSAGGEILLDVSPAKLEFSPVGVIVPEMNVGAGTLSGLTINGRPVSTDVDKGPIAGGRLAALFDIRDNQAPAVQTRLDAAARDLIERFQDPSVDPTLGAADPGLFTDNGAVLVVADEEGLAGRISVNALVDPSRGGALWRLRDGLGAATPGDAGNAQLLNALSDAFTATRTAASGGYTAGISAEGLGGELIATIGTQQSIFARDSVFAQSRAEALISTELELGVDTDIEMQKLLQLEHAFGANAKVLATVDELFETLLRI